MELKTAKALFDYTKGNHWSLERSQENWLLYINNSQVITTARGKKKEYKTIEAAIKDIETITGKKVNKITNAHNETQEALKL